MKHLSLVLRAAVEAAQSSSSGSAGDTEATDLLLRVIAHYEALLARAGEAAGGAGASSTAVKDKAEAPLGPLLLALPATAVAAPIRKRCHLSLHALAAAGGGGGLELALREGGAGAFAFARPQPPPVVCSFLFAARLLSLSNQLKQAK